MAKYTIKNVIIDSEDIRLKGAIGKEVYYGINPYITLFNAIEGKTGIYKGITHSGIFDFFMIEGDENSVYQCIIIKEEEPKEYVPFDTIEEFIKASLEHNKSHYLSGTGIWIRCKKGFNSNIKPFIAAISELHDECVSIGMYNDYLTFNGLLEYCEFLDGTPCGKLEGDSND